MTEQAARDIAEVRLQNHVDGEWVRDPDIFKEDVDSLATEVLQLDDAHAVEVRRMTQEALDELDAGELDVRIAAAKWAIANTDNFGPFPEDLSDFDITTTEIDEAQATVRQVQTLGATALLPVAA